MHIRQFSHNQPEPGRKLGKQEMGARFRRAAKAAGVAFTAGVVTGVGSCVVRKKQLRDEAGHRDGIVAELKKLESVQNAYVSESNTSPGNIDSFMADAGKEMIADLREELQQSNSSISDMEEGMEGAEFVKDGLFASFMVSAIIILGGIGAIIATGNRGEGPGKKPEEGPDGKRERRIVGEIGNPAHAQAPMPAPEPPKPADSEKYKRPDYFDELFPELKKSVAGHVGPFGSVEIAEVLLCVLKRKEVEEIIEWPQALGECVRDNGASIREFLASRNIDPGRLFARLSSEIPDLFSGFG